MALIDSLVAFVVSLLVGAFGIYVGARVVVDSDDYGYAIVTALVGALVWFVVALFFGWIPLLGPLLALLAYVAVINWRYPGDWLAAFGIALIAWVATIVVLYIVGILFDISLEAVGVPGV
ncbi:hypothetical protein [Halobacterium zhouii]|uniref:hypothetical protein n=1 Tax=Halobacterium zhouii TaxID=2902624 RepID=UPI001E32B619|nr:hypothetical protein [Halobacterium zhouii]